MRNPKAYEKYPWSTVLTALVVNLINYAVGFYLLYLIDPLFAGFWIIYLLALEFSVLKEGCCCCYYYGKRCYSGRGLLAPFLVKRENPRKFCTRKVTWKNLLPHVLVNLIPLITGIYLLIKEFDYFILGLALVPILMWFLVSPLLFGKLACPHCKQGRICCPANEFFGKKK